jgi:hypothetical protein
VGFFDWINRWQVVLVTAVIVAGLDLGIYLGVHHFSHQPDTSRAAAHFQERRGSDAPVEDTAPRGGSKEPPQRSAPSPSKSQYGP